MKAKARNMLCIAVVLFLIVVIFGICRNVGNVMAGDLKGDIGTTQAAETKTTYIEYHVKYGDTLWSIADEYRSSGYRTTGDYVRKVEEINHIENGDVLYEGQLLVLPVVIN